MTALYQALMVVIGHSYAAIVEFVVDMGDQVVTHLIMVIVIKAGVLHVGWKVVRRVRHKTVVVPPVQKPQAKKVHKKVGKATR